jgi:hypothetical protein
MPSSGRPKVVKRLTGSFLVSCFFIVLVGHAVNAQSIRSYRDSRTDFSKFKTFAWLAPGDSVLNRPRRDKLYGGAITHFANREITSRGLVPDTTRPDAIFVFYTSVQETTIYTQSATLSMGVGVGGPGYFIGGSAPVAGGKITARTAEDGTLKYAMYDPETGRQVWWGMARRQISMKDDIEKMISAYTTRIFRKFPVKRKKK